MSCMYDITSVRISDRGRLDKCKGIKGSTYPCRHQEECLEGGVPMVGGIENMGDQVGHRRSSRIRNAVAKSAGSAIMFPVEQSPKLIDRNKKNSARCKKARATARVQAAVRAAKTENAYLVDFGDKSVS